MTPSLTLSPSLILSPSLTLSLSLSLGGGQGGFLIPACGLRSPFSGGPLCFLETSACLHAF